jgi:hypothetical protein
MNNTGCLSIIALVFTAYFSVPVLFGPNEEVEINPNDKIVIKECSLMQIDLEKMKLDGAIKKIEEDQGVLYCGDSAIINDVKFFKVIHSSDTGFLAEDEFEQHSTTKYSKFWTELDFKTEKIKFWLIGVSLAIAGLFIKIRSLHKAFLKEHNQG